MRPHRFFAVTIAMAVALAPAACTDAADDEGGSPTASAASPIAETGPAVSPTPPALPETPPPTRGQVATDCVEGWVTPLKGSTRYSEPLRVIRRVTGVTGPLTVVDLRMFEGPESPPSDKGYLLDIRRWYVKAFAKDDLAFQGRFLVESRVFGDGLAAVAAYDTNGYRSPDWVGFQFDSADLEARTYEGLPGLWAGVPYDFVNGGAGLELPGLPDEVAGCLSAT